MSASDVLPTTAPSKSSGPSLHGNDNQVIERRSLRDYYVILRERLWIALPVALLVALSWGYYQAQETPMYSSMATMQFERAERIVQNEQVVDTSVRSDIDLNTYLQILNSGRLRTNILGQNITNFDAVGEKFRFHFVYQRSEKGNSNFSNDVQRLCGNNCVNVSYIFDCFRTCAISDESNKV